MHTVVFSRKSFTISRKAIEGKSILGEFDPDFKPHPMFADAFSRGNPTTVSVNIVEVKDEGSEGKR